MIKKLTIVNGIVQDQKIGEINFKADIVKPSGKHNVRTQILLDLKTALGITNHNTGNNAPTASDEMHAKWMQNVENADETYVGAHFFVDEDSIMQVLPINEVAYHAGDGKGNGNMKTIAIEICENGNILKAEENAKMLNAALILTYPHFKIYKHQDWSGKYCPRVILGRNSWDDFKADIMAYVEDAQKETLKNVVEEWKLKGLEFVSEEEIITDYKYWLANINGELDPWAIFIMIQKTLIKVRQEIKESEDRVMKIINELIIKKEV
ncbi:peptidoglycan recognition protein family protein [Fusibacter ferrireducens]|uniref:N-acetylmuramoyl-L-alanine amidase n=1 Tax=Fusibacter ferrireducens TaxID=2785058 RepID=A0ABR9ZT25_9FIRM|nr:N-acetylmuramoyl-L-alanine amidase [Fusibacter ferrireducens]MBF4693625.1 N-acetylmuramoyl-L-alanine amidase [Fusibacter ferrireducens]